MPDQTTTGDITIATRTEVRIGIELPWNRVERYGPTLNRHTGEWTDNPPRGTVLESGVALIDLATLEALLDADHSLGMGGAYLVADDEGMALEQAGLASQETRGGYYTTREQRDRLRSIIDAVYDARSNPPGSKRGL